MNLRSGNIFTSVTQTVNKETPIKPEIKQSEKYNIQICLTLDHFYKGLCPDQKLILYRIGLVNQDPDFGLKVMHYCVEVGEFPQFGLNERDLKYSINITRDITLILSGMKQEVGQYSTPIFAAFKAIDDETLRISIFDVIVKVYNDETKSCIADLGNTKTTNGATVLFNLVVSESDQEDRAITSFDQKLRKEKKISRLLDALDVCMDSVNQFNLVPPNDHGTIMNWKEMAILRPEIYAPKFIAMTFYEEIQMEYDVRTFDLKKTQLRKTITPMHYEIEVPGLAEKRPSVLKGDKIKITESLPADLFAQEFLGDVLQVKETSIIVRVPEKLYRSMRKENIFNVRFLVNRMSMEMMCSTMETIHLDMRGKNSLWRKFLFPEKTDLRNIYTKPVPIKKFINPLIETNSEQKIAVTEIVNGGTPGLPYIIFGPPGTGKTMTLVEAILQVMKIDHTSRILVSASSNAAADVIALRLVESLPKGNDLICRFYARSSRDRKIPEALVQRSNMKRPILQLEIQKKRILVVTFVTAKKVFDEKKLTPGSFKYIFMDEVGNAMEPEALNSVTGFADLKKTQVVMAGDPKQLGPIVRSALSTQMGLSVSLLDRLMEQEVYKPDPTTGKYNPKLITKLVRNFRSHDCILKVPSMLFYKNELVKCAPPEKTDTFLDWSELPKKGYPIIFHGVVGEEFRDKNNPSFFNFEEALITANYVEKILQTEKVSEEDIAILSPYRGQIRTISDMIKKRRKSNTPLKFTVGSTEELQGQERSVIIISTVRSQVETLAHDFKFNLGFLKNPKRFNVALTRAQALTIVVGNPVLLSLDSNWKSLIEDVIANGGYRGYHSDLYYSEGIITLQSLVDRFTIIDLNSNPTDLDLCGNGISEKEREEEPEWNYEI